jgi:DNA replication protein DnaC
MKYKMSLSKEQSYAFEKFKKGENLFITGPGGTGKTRLIHTLISHM